MNASRPAVGHPVDVASGNVYTTNSDYSIDGRATLSWVRRFSNSLVPSGGSPLGPGWTSRYFMKLSRQKGEYQLLGTSGEIESFFDPTEEVERGGVSRNVTSCQELVRRGDRYQVTCWHTSSGVVERFLFAQRERGGDYLLESINDVTGVGLDMVRDAANRLIGVRQRREQRMMQLEYDRQGHVSEVFCTLSNGSRQTLVRYEYDERGRLSAAFDAMGNADRYEYDAAGRLARELMKDGGEFNFNYDDRGRCVRVAGINGFDEKRLKYYDAAHFTEVTDSHGATSRYQFNAIGQVVQRIDAVGAQYVTEYDDLGRVVAEVGPSGAATKYEYDAFGNLCATVDPLDRAFRYVFNDAHLPIEFVEPSGARWQRRYDEQNRLVSVTNPLGDVWTVGYDAQGNVIKRITPSGRTVHSSYNAQGILQTSSDYRGGRSQYAWDDLGRLSKVTLPDGRAYSYLFDAMGRLREQELPPGMKVRYAYDVAGNVTSITDAEGRVHRYKFGRCKRLLKKWDPDGREVSFRWDKEPGRLLSVTNELGEVYAFQHDAVGRIVRETNFNGEETSYAYDSRTGEIAKRDAAGETTIFKRDAVRRLVEQITPDGAATRFEYDKMDQLIAAENADCKCEFERDLLGRIIKETQDDVVIEMRFDADGRRVFLGTSLGDSFEYSHDENGFVSGIVGNGRIAIGFERAPSGRETLRRLPGGLAFEQVYDSANRLAGQRLARGDGSALGRSYATVLARSYQYDQTGRLVEMMDSDGRRLGYQYDLTGRLLQAGTSAAPEAFSYDAAGRLTVRSKSGETVRIECAPGGRPERVGQDALEYDAVGRLKQRTNERAGAAPSRSAFHWDANSKLRKFVAADGKVWNYRYDPFGRRISKECDGRFERFVWDGDQVLHQRHDDDSHATWINDPHGFEPVCRMQGDDVRIVVTDHLGTPRELVDASSRVVWQSEHEAWGATRLRTGSLADCPHRFPGQWFDAESGLHYNRFRYYAPDLGCYISPDPIGLLGGPRPYGYTLNPVNWLDPLGLADGDAPYFFRGTSEGFEGSPGCQRAGCSPTTTDPGHATVFGTESQNYGNGIVQVFTNQDVAGIGRDPDGNIQGLPETKHEVVMHVKPADLPAPSVTVSAADARAILADMGIHVPPRMDISGISPTIAGLPDMTPDQIEEFVKRAKEKSQEGAKQECGGGG